MENKITISLEETLELILLEVTLKDLKEIKDTNEIIVIIPAYNKLMEEFDIVSDDQKTYRIPVSCIKEKECERISKNYLIEIISYKNHVFYLYSDFPEEKRNLKDKLDTLVFLRDNKYHECFTYKFTDTGISGFAIYYRSRKNKEVNNGEEENDDTDKENINKILSLKSIISNFVADKKFFDDKK